MPTTSTSSAFEFSLPTVIAGALILTAALAWNEAAKAGIQDLYPGPDGGSFHATLVYAVIVTIRVVIIFYTLRAATRVAKKVKNSSMTSAPPRPRTPRATKKRAEARLAFFRPGRCRSASSCTATRTTARTGRHCGSNSTS